MSSSNLNNPNQAPQLLPPLPKRGPGVRRLNKLPLLAGACVFAMVAGAFAYSIYQRGHAAETTAKEAEHTATAGKAAAVANAPDGEDIPAETVQKAPVSAAPTAEIPPPPGAAPTDPQQQPDSPELRARKQAWDTYYQQLADLQRQRLDGQRDAMKAETMTGSGRGTGSLAGLAGGQGGSEQIASARPALSADSGESAPGGPGFGGAGLGGVGGGLGAGLGSLGGLGAGYPVGAPPHPDPGDAREKLAFTNQTGQLGQDDTLQATVRDPISSYLVTAGDFIPCVAVGGENSDAPGQFTARVTQNVYDSATGRYLLIPQNAKVIGRYDNVVSVGQSRIPTVMTRIIYPDSESLDIGAMPAADQSGMAGPHDLVDTHLWAKFGNALILAAASAGIQISQGTGQSTNGYNSQQIGAAAIGQQFGELGEQYAAQGLAIPNTLIVRPGYKIVIQVTKDIVLRPYHDERLSGGIQASAISPVMQ